MMKLKTWIVIQSRLIHSLYATMFQTALMQHSMSIVDLFQNALECWNVCNLQLIGRMISPILAVWINVVQSVKLMLIVMMAIQGA